MFISLDHLTPWLMEYKYSVLLPAAIVEGPIITIIAGFFIAHGYLNGLVAYGVLVAGDLIGDSLYYALGRWGKLSFIDRWGKYIGITPERVTHVERHFTSHSGKTLLLGKLTHGVGSVFLMAAGVANMPFGPFLWFNFLGTLPKSLALLLVGFYFGQAYRHLNRYLNYTALGVLLLSVVSILLYQLVIKRLLKKASPPDLPL